MSEFYKQKDRYESQCKTCKKSSRSHRIKKTLEHTLVVPLEAKPSPPKISIKPEFIGYPPDLGLEPIPEYDESIFYPEKKLAAKGFSRDDIEELLGFLRWHLDQRNKRLKK